MANITIKGITEDTLNLIKKKASANSRSLNKEIIDLLNRHAKIQAYAKDDLLKELNKAKLLFKGKLSATNIRSAIDNGRK